MNGWLFATRTTARAGCKHYGAGVGRTVIQLVGASNGPGDGYIFGSSYNERADGFEVHDMTLDCNATAQPKWSSGSARFVGAINTRGSNITIDNVEVINFGTKSAGTELFPLFICSDALVGDFSNNTVSRCYVHSPVSGNLDGCSTLTVGFFQAGATGHNNVARDNIVDMTGNDFTYSHGPYGLFVSGNYVTGCSDGFYTEPTGTYPSNIIRSNTYASCGQGVTASAHVGSTIQNLTIEDNYFIDTNNAAAIGIASDDSLLTHYAGVVIRNNNAFNSDGSVTAKNGLSMTSCTNAIVTGNVFDSSASLLVKATHAFVAENRTLAGALLGYTLNTVVTPQSVWGNAPLIVKAKSVTVNTATSPTDIAIIPIPFSRWMIGQGTVIFETSSGSMSSAQFTAWDAAGGAGGGAHQLTITGAGPFAVGGNNSRQDLGPIVPTSGQSWTSSANLYIRQSVDSASAGTVSFYFTIIPLQ